MPVPLLVVRRWWCAAGGAPLVVAGAAPGSAPLERVLPPLIRRLPAITEVDLSYSNATDFDVKLLGELGFAGPDFFPRMNSPDFDIPGVHLWRKPIKGKGSVTIRLEGDMDLQIVALPLSGKA